MVLDNDTRGWIMAVVSGIGMLESIVMRNTFANQLQHARLEVEILYSSLGFHERYLTPYSIYNMR